MAPDLYEVLRITASASPLEVQNAYRALALQYHPDRNASPDAASRMAEINEAYWVLGDAIRRREYDRIHAGAGHEGAGAVIQEAYEKLLKQGWIASESSDCTVVLEQGFRAVRVTFAARADNRFLTRASRQFAGFSVVMAVEIETPFNLSFTTAVIDLKRARHYGAPFPDEAYRALFAPFVAAP